MNVPGTQWSASEAATVNDFLNTPVGRKWISVLLLLKPQVDRDTMEKAALSGAYAAGYEYVINFQIPATRIVRTEENASAKTIDMTKD